MIASRYQQISSLLSREEKVSGFKLLVLILAMGLADVIGVASIMPFMSLASDSSFIESNRAAFAVYQFFDFSSYSDFIIFSGVAVILLVATSTAVKVVASYAMYTFTFNREYTISMRLLKGYMNQPYGWFLGEHSAELSKSILADVREVVARCILSSIMVASNVFTIVLIITMLIAVDPLTAFLVFTFFGGVYLTLYFCVAKILSRVGTERLEANAARFKVASEIFSLIKEIKISNKEFFYAQIFGRATKKFVEKEITTQLISTFPRYGIEMIVFIGLVGVVLYNVTDDVALARVIPTLALYAFAIYRLIPALQTIFANISSFKSSVAVLDSITAKYSAIKIGEGLECEDERMDLHSGVTFSNVSFHYPGAEKNAVSEISFSIKARSIVGIIGATGSGKTTIIDIFLGLLFPTTGQLVVDDVKIKQENVRRWQKCIGYVPQHITLTDESVAENIALGHDPESIDMDAIVAVAKIANIHDFVVENLKYGYKTKIGDKGARLSGGQRQRLGIARALYHKPSVLVLDEATSALDGDTEQVVMEAVNNLGRDITIIIIAHRLSTLSRADVVYRLDSGRLHSKGSYAEMCGPNLEDLEDIR